MSRAEIEKRFTYHAPPDDATKEVYVAIREGAKGLAQFIDDITPDSREKALALTKLEEAVMHANSAVARNGIRPNDYTG